MNKVNITAKDDFPMDSDGMDFIQKMIHQVYRLAKLGGGNYILEGCIEANGVVSDGQVVIDGELMDFKGGLKQDYVVVIETKETIYDEDENGEEKEYPEAYISRYATFTDDGKLKWDKLNRIISNEQLNEKIESLKSEAPGFVKHWSGLVERLDDEFMLCDGRILNTKDYPELAWYYGKENSESFRIPDLRGKFITGLDSTRDSYKEIGLEGGSEFVTPTIENVPPHDHVYSDDINARNGFPNIESGFPRLYDAVTSNTSAKSEGTGAAFYTTKSGGRADGSVAPLENRPPFYVLAYVIRVKY